MLVQCQENWLFCDGLDSFPVVSLYIVLNQLCIVLFISISCFWKIVGIWQDRLNTSVADPGFPVGGRQLSRRLHFKYFVCKGERNWTIGRGDGAGRVGGAPSIRQCTSIFKNNKQKKPTTVLKLISCLKISKVHTGIKDIFSERLR